MKDNLAYDSEEDVINAAMHIMESRMLSSDFYRTTLSTCNYFKLRLGHLERAVFSVMFLSNQHQLIITEDVSFGTIDSATVYAREVVKLALQHNAAACVLSHSRPSGDIKPSVADKQITTRLIEALGLVDVRVLDHIIVSGSQYMSFAERGLI